MQNTISKEQKSNKLKLLKNQELIEKAIQNQLMNLINYRMMLEWKWKKCERKIKKYFLG